MHATDTQERNREADLPMAERWQQLDTPRVHAFLDRLHNEDTVNMTAQTRMD